jgi:hypothetical protein
MEIARTRVNINAKIQPILISKRKISNTKDGIVIKSATEVMKGPEMLSGSMALLNASMTTSAVESDKKIAEITLELIAISVAAIIESKSRYLKKARSSRIDAGIVASHTEKKKLLNTYLSLKLASEEPR